MSQRRAKTDRKSAAYRERLLLHKMRIQVAFLARQIPNQESLDKILAPYEGAKRQAIFDTYKPFLRFENPKCWPVASEDEDPAEQGVTWHTSR